MLGAALSSRRSSSLLDDRIPSAKMSPRAYPCGRHAICDADKLHLDHTGIPRPASSRKSLGINLEEGKYLKDPALFLKRSTTLFLARFRDLSCGKRRNFAGLTES